jgi:crotonobetainyl-CoA:carnitine CoA-transferase CaiB-like acyl-CoA transferase
MKQTSEVAMRDLLKGVRVLDLTRFLPGPYATLLLADLGAEVIKIEELKVGDPVRWLPPFANGKSARFEALNRNKKSLTLDLKKPEGREIFLKLAESADVIVEGFRPGVAERLQINYKRVREVNPDIIYCSLSGYGQTGPYRDHVGHDVNYLARAGLLSLTGRSEPVIPGVPVADLAGGMFAAFSVVSALLARERHPERSSVYLDVSLTDAVISWLSLHFAETLTLQKPLRPDEVVLTGAYPCYALYETKDGRWLAVGALEEKFWRKLCETLGVFEFSAHQFDAERRDEIFTRLEEIFRSKTLDEWLEVLDPKEIPIAPVLNLWEVAHDPHAQGRKLLQPPGISFPVQIANAGEREDRPAPELGEHTRVVLEGIGYSGSEIDELAAKGVI